VLLGTAITDGARDVMLFSSANKAVRFREDEVRAMGRSARGVRGIRLGEGEKMIALIIPQEGGRVLTVSENGYGKRTLAEDFPTKGRGTMGVIAMQISERNGGLAGAVQVFAGDELMLISDQGTMVRTRTDEVSELSRNTQGVRVIRLKEGEKLVGVERIPESPEAEPAGERAVAQDGEAGSDDDSDYDSSQDGDDNNDETDSDDNTDSGEGDEQ
jgi:DNA gyrase subunit A